METFKSEFFKGYVNSKTTLTKKEQLEKVFVNILEANIYLDEYELKPIVKKLIKEVSIRTNLK